MMVISLLSCLILLTACTNKPISQPSEELFYYKPYPAKPKNLTKQSQVARLLVNSKLSYDSCSIAVDTLKTFYIGENNVN